MINTFFKKLNEIEIHDDSCVITLILDNELDALVAHSHLVKLFKNQELELFFHFSKPRSKKRSKIDLGIFSIDSHEQICVKEIEIENATALYSKLLSVKSKMNGLVQNQDPMQPSLIISSRENGVIDTSSNGFIKIKKLTIISTPGGSEILKIPGGISDR